VSSLIVAADTAVGIVPFMAKKKAWDGCCDD
jgi:hypothetical protein